MSDLTHRHTSRFLAFAALVCLLGVLLLSSDASAQAVGQPLPNLKVNEQQFFSGGQEFFNIIWTPQGGSVGFGPLFTKPGCVACHSVPVSGGSGFVQDTRFGKLNADGSFNDLENEGGPLLHANSIGAQSKPSNTQQLKSCNLPANTVPADATIISLRQTPPIFGDGLLDALADATILANSSSQATDPFAQSLGIAGVPNMVTDVNGTIRPGRFGWKAVQSSLLGFAADAEDHELSITNAFLTGEAQPMSGSIPASCLVAPSQPGDLPGTSTNNTVKFAFFMSLSAPPPPLAQSSAAAAGEQVFTSLGCAVCHMQNLTTQANFKMPTDYPKPLGSGTTDAALVLSNQLFNPYSDLLLHNMGPGLSDNTPQGQAAGNQWRTTPLWGLSTVKVANGIPLLHDGRCSGPAAVTCAIEAHGGEATIVIANFQALSVTDQANLLAFLSSL